MYNKEEILNKIKNKIFLTKLEKQWLKTQDEKFKKECKKYEESQIIQINEIKINKTIENQKEWRKRVDSLIYLYLPKGYRNY